MSKRSNSAALTTFQRDFINTYRKYGGNTEKVTKALNISIHRMYNILGQDAVKEHLSRSIQESREMVEAASPMLIQKAIEMVYDDNVSDKVKSTLINSLLDRAGIVKQQQPILNVNINYEIANRAREIMASTIDTEPLP